MLSRTNGIQIISSEEGIASLTFTDFFGLYTQFFPLQLRFPHIKDLSMERELPMSRRRRCGCNDGYVWRGPLIPFFVLALTLVLVLVPFCILIFVFVFIFRVGLARFFSFMLRNDFLDVLWGWACRSRRSGWSYGTGTG
jgi:hypothetical protein